MTLHGDQTPPTTRRARNVLGALLALTCAAVLATACSSGSSAPSVASLPGHSAGGGRGTALTSAQSDRDMISFAQCMRSHGVQMNDPAPIPGRSGVRMELPTLAAAVRPAYNACVHFIQKIIDMKMAGAGAALPAARLAALTRYARCMRGHDIAMPAPGPYGQLNLGNVPGMNSDFGRYSPQFRSADSACRHLLPAGVRDNGTGP